MAFILFFLLFSCQALAILAQTPPESLPPFLYPLLKRAKVESRQGQTGSETERVRVLLKHFSVKTPSFLVNIQPVEIRKTPENIIPTDLQGERVTLERRLRMNPTDSTTRNRLLEIAQILDDQPEILRHQAILKPEHLAFPSWEKTVLLIVLIALVLHQLYAILRQTGWLNGPFDRSGKLPPDRSS